MKTNYLKYLLILTFLFVGTMLCNAQNICQECEECEETIDETEYSVDIGEEGGEMGLEEADMLGTEVGSEVGEATVEEIATDLTTEILASTSVLDAIPGVGELIEGLALLGLAIYELYEAIHGAQIQHEHEIANALHGGEYTLPLIPSFTTSVDDLNGKKDTVSYLFFLKKKIGAQDVKDYIEQRGMTQHIDKTYDISKLNDHMSYAFSEFTTQTKGVSPGEERIDKIKLPIRYKKRAISEVTFHQEMDATTGKQQWYYNYNAVWRHNQHYSYSERYGRPIGSIGELKRFVRSWTYDLNTSYTLPVKKPIEFWYAKRKKNGAFDYIRKIPDSKLHIEDFNNDQIAVRIKNFKVDASSKSEPFYIVMKTKTPNNLVRNSNAWVFPENWNPQEIDYRYKLTYADTDPTRPGYTRRVAMNDSGIYPNTKGLVPDFRAEDIGTLISFRVHDYQPKDTEKTIAEKRKIKTPYNVFPKIHTSGITEYANDTIERPEPGKSNLHIDIPLGYKDKKIAYIELEVLTDHHTIVITPFNYTILKEGSYSSQVKANFNDGKTSNNSITAIGLEVANLDQPNEEWYIRYPNQISYRRNIASVLLKNAPVEAGDMVNVSTFYEDGSLSRDLILMKAVANNVLPRSYYHLFVQDNSTELKVLQYDTLSKKITLKNNPRIKSNWLIEHQDGGAYAIMNKKEKKVLGIENGKVGLFQWEQGNINLLWQLRYSDYSTVELFHFGQQAFLKAASRNNPSNNWNMVFNFNGGTEFELVPTQEGETIRSEESTILSNRSGNKVLDVNNLGNPILAVPKDNDPGVNTQSHKIEYQGCLHYSIYNKGKKKYLNNSDYSGLQWGNTQNSSWLLTETDEDFFTLTTNGRPLFSKVAGGEDISVDYTDSADTEDHRYQFGSQANKYSDLIAHYALDGDANDSSVYGLHGTSYSNIDDSQGVEQSLEFVDDTSRGLVAKFDGVDDYIDTNFNFHPKDYGGSLSASVWMKTNNWGDTYGRLLDADSWSMTRNFTGGGVRHYTYHNNTDGLFYWITAPANIADGNWHFVTIVMKPGVSGGTDKELYVDGLKINSGNVNLALRDTPVNTFIGKWSQNYTKNYEGLMDDVKFWGKALSEEEVLKEYNETKKDGDLLAYYRFENNSNDDSGNDHHATVKGEVSYELDPVRGWVVILNDENDYLDTNFNFNPLNYGGELTASIWMRAKREGSINNLINADNWLITGTNNNGTIIAYTKQEFSYNYKYLSANQYVKDDKWHHVTMVIKPTKFGGNIRELYLDGILVESNKVEGHMRNEEWNTLIGASEELENDGKYIGLLDEMKIWGKALSPSDIIEEYLNSLKEGQKGINLAYKKSTKQSSEYSHGGTSKNAVDGNTSGLWTDGSVTHTNNESQPWWDVDLGRLADIDEIKIYNRSDCCSDRLKNYHILISKTPFTSTSLSESQDQAGVFDFHETSKAKYPTTIDIGKQGRYVRIQLEGTGILSLAEVEVFGSFPLHNIDNLALNKEAEQSSDFQQAFASRAVDGNISGAWEFESISQTLKDNQAWWEVDLGKLANIDEILINNRLDDCCPAQLRNYHILISKTPFTSKDLSESQDQEGVLDYHEVYGAAYPTRRTIDKQGRYIRIQLEETGVLSLAEVQVYGTYVIPTDGTSNLALKKPTEQSSDYPHGGISNNAVDNYTSGLWDDGSVTHTGHEAQPWWDVDIGQLANINEIKIYNRSDCCSDRLKNYYIFLSEKPFESTHLEVTKAQEDVINFHEPDQAGFPTTRAINKKGRYIRIQLEGNGILSLAEVQVYGTYDKPQNLALNKPTEHSSEYPHGGTSKNAVDGNTSGLWNDGSVTHTGHEAQPWWDVDLGQLADIDDIKIYNRSDCCSDRLKNYYIFLSEKPFESDHLEVTKAQEDVIKFHEPDQAGFPTTRAINKKGRYIRIQLEGNGILSLAEVQVYGTYSTPTDESQNFNTNFIPDFHELVIYPNESDGNFNMGFGLSQAVDVSYRIIDFSEQILLSDSRSFKKGSHIWPIQANQLSTGIYVIEVTLGTRKERRRIVINNN